MGDVIMNEETECGCESEAYCDINSAGCKYPALVKSLESGQQDMDYLREKLAEVEKDLSVIRPAFEEAVRQKIVVEKELDHWKGIADNADKYFEGYQELQERATAAESELKAQVEFNAAFADKLKEFGTIDKLIESYSATKIELRAARERIQKFEWALLAVTRATHLNFAKDHAEAALTPGGTSGGV